MPFREQLLEAFADFEEFSNSFSAVLTRRIFVAPQHFLEAF